MWDGEVWVTDAVVEIEDGRITRAGSGSGMEASSPGQGRHYAGATITPAYFDVHIHGAAGHDVMEATPEALGKVGRFLGTRGTGTFLATTVTAPLELTLRSLEGLARRVGESEADGEPGRGARPVGIHLEGPFLSHAKRGVHPPNHLLAPDTAIFDRMFEAAEGRIRLVTVAPELPGAVEFIRHVAGRGVRVSVGHSNATAAETRAGMDAGATSATHTFNAMRALDHREPGILGMVLSTDDLYAELICDGVHVDPALVKLWWRAKGVHRAILVTDGMSAAGMPDGEYLLGGLAVQVADGRATSGGVLAGSVLTLDRALENFLSFSGASLGEGLRLVTTNPAAMLGVDSGRLAVGAIADLNVVDGAGRLLAAYCGGKELAPE